MKRFKVTKAYILPPLISWMIAAISGGLMAFDYCNDPNGDVLLRTVLFAIFAPSFLTVLLNSIVDSQRIQVCAESMRLSVMGVTIKKYLYDTIKLVVISNAVYTLKSGARWNYELGEYIRTNRKRQFVQYGYLTLFKDADEKHKLSPDLDSQKLIFTLDQSIFGSICWAEYLEELLPHIKDAPVYILQEVYERFKEDYDRIFSSAENTVYIVTAPNSFQQLIF